MGGLSGKDALTAYVAIALMQADEQAAAGKAVSYLETRLDDLEDAYTTALVAYALELADSPMKEEAYQKLMALAKEDENGLYWGDDAVIPPLEKGFAPGPFPARPRQTAAIETTGYAALALIKHGDLPDASRAAKWLISKRNASGGFGSTQDTVVALEALTEFGSGARADIDLKVKVESRTGTKELRIKKDNFDVLQVLALPADDTVKITTSGKGEAIAQMVRRFNLPEAEKTAEEILKINVKYDAAEVAVNDLINVSVRRELQSAGAHGGRHDRAGYLHPHRFHAGNRIHRCARGERGEDEALRRCRPEGHLLHRKSAPRRDAGLQFPGQGDVPGAGQGRQLQGLFLLSAGNQRRDAQQRHRREVGVKDEADIRPSLPRLADRSALYPGLQRRQWSGVF